MGMVSLTELSLVACGGAIGSSLRFIVGRFCEVMWEAAKFPIATLFVNLVGCILIGVMAGATLRYGSSPLLRIFFVTGILGGFTTFSAFGLETVSLMRGGHIALSLLYVLVSVLGGCVGVFLGLLVSEPPTPLS
jgi:CrcB protein